MRTILLLLTACFYLGAGAQTGAYRKDLEALHQSLRQTPSYKDQVRGEAKEAYEQRYAQLLADSLHPVGSYAYFFNLCQLLFPLRDNHLGFYQLPDYSRFRTKETIDAYVQSAEFAAYPRLTLNTDSLKQVLAQKPVDSIEGLYAYDRHYTVGVFRSGPQQYTGVVVESTLNLWPVGQVALQLYETGPGRYKAIYGHSLTKNFIYQAQEKLVNGALVNSRFYGSYFNAVFRKKAAGPDVTNLPEDAPLFALKTIRPNVQYLLVRTFQASNEKLAQSRRFLDSIQDALVAPYLLLDLRNNEGGAEKASKVYLDLLKAYTKKGKVLVLQNNGTLSRAEILLLQLKGLPNLTKAGQTTRGMLTYGSNEGKRVRLPSGRFELYPTDMNGKKEHLAYEDRGIDPDIWLDAKTEWVEQALEKWMKQLRQTPGGGG